MSERDVNISLGVSVSENDLNTEYTAKQRRRRLVAERLLRWRLRDVSPSQNQPR